MGRWRGLWAAMVALVAALSFGVEPVLAAHGFVAQAVGRVAPSVVRIDTERQAFAGVVVMTMFAAHRFDPRLIWDQVTENKKIGNL